MYIDSHSIEVRGNKYNEKKDKYDKDMMLATHSSSEGMDIKKLIPLIEEFADSHSAHHKITINVRMHQNEY